MTNTPQINPSATNTINFPIVDSSDVGYIHYENANSTHYRWDGVKWDPFDIHGNLDQEYWSRWPQKEIVYPTDQDDYIRVNGMQDVWVEYLPGSSGAPNPPPTPIGAVLELTIRQRGLFYRDMTNVDTINKTGKGKGLKVNIATNGAGGIIIANILKAGEDYQPGDRVVVNQYGSDDQAELEILNVA